MNLRSDQLYLRISAFLFRFRSIRYFRIASGLFKIRPSTAKSFIRKYIFCTADKTDNNRFCTRHRFNLELKVFWNPKTRAWLSSWVGIRCDPLKIR